MGRQLVNTLLGLVMLTVSGKLSAQPLLQTGADNSFVTARANDGLLNFSQADKTLLSFQYKSFLSVRVDGQVYTNNDSPVGGAKHFSSGLLEQHEDSLIVTWQESGFVLTQISYPQLTQNG